MIAALSVGTSALAERAPLRTPPGVTPPAPEEPMRVAPDPVRKEIADDVPYDRHRLGPALGIFLFASIGGSSGGGFSGQLGLRYSLSDSWRGEKKGLSTVAAAAVVVDLAVSSALGTIVAPTVRFELAAAGPREILIPALIAYAGCGPAIATGPRPSGLGVRAVVGAGWNLFGFIDDEPLGNPLLWTGTGWQYLPLAFLHAELQHVRFPADLSDPGHTFLAIGFAL